MDRRPERIVGIGIDLIDSARVEKAWARWRERLTAKLMDDDEASRLPHDPRGRAAALARSVAIKEAASKAIGTGWSRGVRWRDVVVSDGSSPRVQLRARAEAFARARGSDGVLTVDVEERDGLVYAEALLLAPGAAPPAR